MFIGHIPTTIPTNSTRASVISEKDWEKGNFFASPVSAAGVSVTADSAMHLATYYACSRVICEDLASLPLLTYNILKDGSRELAFDDPLYWLLRKKPNDKQTPMDFMELMTNDMMNIGCALARIILNGRGEIAELRRMHPARTRRYKTSKGKLAFEWTDDDNVVHQLAWDEVFKLHGPFGMSVLEFLRETLGSAIVQDKYSAKYFSNFGKPGGVITTKRSFEDDEAIERFKKGWNDKYAGIDNAYSVAILEEGMEWKPTEVKNSDAQWLETAKLTDRRICGGMRVPPHMIGILDDATFSNIDSQQLSYYIQSLRSWCVRWEQSIERDLVLPSRMRDQEVEFDVDELLRGDIVARGNFYASMRQNGNWSANDVRKKEKQNSIGPQGDIYLVQAGYVPANLMIQAKSLQDLKGITTAPGKKDPGKQGKDGNGTED